MTSEISQKRLRQVTQMPYFATYRLAFIFISLLVLSGVSSALWWNTTYNYSIPINCTSIQNGTPIMINGSAGFIINGSNERVWTNCQPNLNLYFNSQFTYAVANDTAQFPMEVESGNGTSFNSTMVWTSSNVILAAHFSPKNGVLLDSAYNVNATVGSTGAGLYSNATGQYGNAIKFVNGNAFSNIQWAYDTRYNLCNVSMDLSWNTFGAVRADDVAGKQNAGTPQYMIAENGAGTHSLVIGSGYTNPQPDPKIWTYTAASFYPTNLSLYWWNTTSGNGSQALGSSCPPNNTNAFFIGANSYNSNANFTIEDFRLYNTSLPKGYFMGVRANQNNTVGYGSLGGINKISANGVDICANSPSGILTASIVVQDDFTGAVLNVSHAYSIVSNTSSSTGGIIINNFQMCLFPSGATYPVSFNDYLTLSGYLSKTYSLGFTATNTNQNFLTTLINSSMGAYYTFTTTNVYSVPIQDAMITVERVNGTAFIVVNSGSSDYLGNVIFPLQQLITYRINISANGYNPISFAFIPASSTTIQVQLSQSSGLNITGFQGLQDTFWNVTAGGYFNSSKTIQYQLFNNASTLAYWGMYITNASNGNATVVFIQNSTNATGGLMAYVAVPNGTYTAYPFFQRIGDTKFNIMPTSYYVRSNSIGLASIRELLASGLVVSGWTFYFIALAISVGIGLGIYKYSGGSSMSALGALASLSFFTYLAPSNMYVFPPFVTPLLATIAIGIGTLATIYLTSGS